MTILVHQELRVPSKVMMVLIRPSTSTPSTVPKHVTGAAGEQGAADDDRGDGVQFHADGEQRVAGLDVERTAARPSAEQKPLIVYTAIFVRPTGRPISSADCSLPPIAYTLRPKRV